MFYAENIIQAIGVLVILVCLALIVFTVSGGWRLPVKRRKLECWANIYSGYAVFHSTEEMAKRAAKRKGVDPLRVAVYMREV